MPDTKPLARMVVACDYSHTDQPNHTCVVFVEAVPDLPERCRRAAVAWLSTPDGWAWIDRNERSIGKFHWHDLCEVPAEFFAAEGLTVAPREEQVAHVDKDEDLFDGLDLNAVSHGPTCAQRIVSSAECDCGLATARSILEDR